MHKSLTNPEDTSKSLATHVMDALDGGVEAKAWDPWEAGIWRVQWWGVSIWMNRAMLHGILSSGPIGFAGAGWYLYKRLVGACMAFWWIVDKCIIAVKVIVIIMTTTAWWKLQSKAGCNNGVNFDANWTGWVSTVWCR